MIKPEFEKMGLDHLAARTTRKLRARDEEEGEGVRTREQASVEEFRVEIEALRVLAVRGMGLDELVVEGESWVVNTVEHLVCIVNVGNF